MDKDLLAPVFALVVGVDELSEEDYRRLLIFIKNAKLILDWHSPFRGFFIIQTEAEVHDLSEIFHEYFDGLAPYFLVPIKLKQNSGALPEQTWTWLKQLGFKTKVGIDAQTH